MQGQLHQHALRKIGHHGHKQRASRQPGVAHDFWHMFVRQPQRVHLQRRSRSGLIGFHHAAPAARITADTGQAHRRIRANQPGVYQRTQERNRARGVATGVGNAAGAGNRRALAGAQLGETVDPVRVRAVCGRRVNDARPAPGFRQQCVGHGHGLYGCVVMQTQDHHVGAGQQGALGLRVFAQRRVDRQQFNLRHVVQALADLQARGAGLSINKYGVHQSSKWGRAGRGGGVWAVSLGKGLCAAP